MGDIALSACTVYTDTLSSGLKTVTIVTAATVDAADVITPINLAEYGIADDGLILVEGWVHTTTNSVITVEANTCSVTSGVLSVTIAAGTDDDIRVIRITGRSY